MQHNQDLKKVLAAIVKHSPGMVDRVCQERHWNLFLIGIKKISVPNFKKIGILHHDKILFPFDNLSDDNLF
jgi:hypothetical protein